jgi:hypothetical protein
MIEEKDAVALDLVKRHGGLEMPNFRLEARQVASIVDYLREKERKMAEAGGAHTPPARQQDGALIPR